MNSGEQVIVIPALAASFTAVCERCAALNSAEGFSSSTFAGRLDADLDGGTFLCRRGHAVRVEREQPGAATAAA